MLSPLLMQILISSGVRIATVLGSPLNNTLRSSFSFLCTEVSFRIATIHRTLIFLCWWPSYFFRIDRTENVDHSVQVWCFWRLHGDSYIATALMFVVTSFACVHIYALIPMCNPVWICSGREHSGGSQYSHADSSWRVPLLNIVADQLVRLT